MKNDGRTVEVVKQTINAMLLHHSLLPRLAGLSGLLLVDEEIGDWEPTSQQKSPILSLKRWAMCC